MDILDKELSLMRKAMDILLGTRGSRSCESTGLRPQKTPMIEAMTKAVKALGIAALVSTAACSSQYPGMQTGYGQQVGYGQPGQQPGAGQSGFMGFSSASNLAGTAGGAALGGFIGDQFGHGTGKIIATALGAFIGGIGGNYITQPSQPPQQPVPGMSNMSMATMGQQPVGMGGYGGGAMMAGAVGFSAYEISMMHNAERTAYNTPTGSQITWRNPQNGNGVTIIPAGDPYPYNGTMCRKFAMTVFLGNQVRQGSAVACQDNNGNWRVLALVNAPFDGKIHNEKIQLAQADESNIKLTPLDTVTERPLAPAPDAKLLPLDPVTERPLAPPGQGWQDEELSQPSAPDPAPHIHSLRPTATNPNPPQEETAESTMSFGFG